MSSLPRMKVALLGPASAGKSSFLRRALMDEFRVEYTETPAIRVSGVALVDATGAMPSLEVSFYDCGARALASEGGHRWRNLCSGAAAVVV